MRAGPTSSVGPANRRSSRVLVDGARATDTEWAIWGRARASERADRIPYSVEVFAPAYEPRAALRASVRRHRRSLKGALACSSFTPLIKCVGSRHSSRHLRGLKDSRELIGLEALNVLEGMGDFYLGRARPETLVRVNCWSP